MGAGRAIGVPFLFGSFLFGQAKRKELGRPTGARNRFETGENQEAKSPLTPTLSPNDETIEGEGASNCAVFRASERK